MPVCVKLFIEHHNHTALSHYFGHLSRDAESWIKKKGKRERKSLKTMLKVCLNTLSSRRLLLDELGSSKTSGINWDCRLFIRNPRIKTTCFRVVYILLCVWYFYEFCSHAIEAKAGTRQFFKRESERLFCIELTLKLCNFETFPIHIDSLNPTICPKRGNRF